MPEHIRLGVNIDHVATIRNARGGNHPDPVQAAILAAEAGADGITAHLREDRRHISDDDIARLKQEISLPLNLEMAATQEMLEIALNTRPNAACIVPEKRQELTTEGGLNVEKQLQHITSYTSQLKQADIRVSLFVDPSELQIRKAAEAGADIVELHTGTYCESLGDDRDAELEKICGAARLANSIGLEVHAGHGLSYDTVRPIIAIPEVVELNIGHFLIGEAIFNGLKESVRHMRQIMDEERK